jgi:hypothetical protein
MKVIHEIANEFQKVDKFKIPRNGKHVKINEIISIITFRN